MSLKVLKDYLFVIYLTGGMRQRASKGSHPLVYFPDDTRAGAEKG